MFRVKCKGFDGDLLSIYAHIVYSMSGQKSGVYDIEIGLSPSEKVSLKGISSSEIKIISE